MSGPPAGCATGWARDDCETNRHALEVLEQIRVELADVRDRQLAALSARPPGPPSSAQD